MNRFFTRASAATVVAAGLFAGSVTGPAVMAEGPAPSAVNVQFETPALVTDLTESWASIPAPAAGQTNSTTLADFNPVAVKKADAAWWHIGIRKWGKVCGHIWLGGDRYEVKKEAYGYTSSKPTCQRTGKTVILRNLR